jgi:purine-binding chemotaxis protein CheW
MHLQIRLGAEHYALALEHVLEVVELGEITPVPGSPAAVLGLRNLRGEILPALDLSALLGILGDGEPRRLVVVAEGGRRAGLAVDDVIDFSELAAARASDGSALLLGRVLVDGALVGVLDTSAVLGTRPGPSLAELA